MKFQTLTDKQLQHLGLSKELLMYGVFTSNMLVMCDGGYPCSLKEHQNFYKDREDPYLKWLESNGRYIFNGLWGLPLVFNSSYQASLFSTQIVDFLYPKMEYSLRMDLYMHSMGDTVFFKRFDPWFKKVCLYYSKKTEFDHLDIYSHQGLGYLDIQILSTIPNYLFQNINQTDFNHPDFIYIKSILIETANIAIDYVLSRYAIKSKLSDFTEPEYSKYVAAGFWSLVSFRNMLQNNFDASLLIDFEAKNPSKNQMVEMFKNIFNLVNHHKISAQNIDLA